jgi:hypothetical protein
LFNECEQVKNINLDQKKFPFGYFSVGAALSRKSVRSQGSQGEYAISFSDHSVRIAFPSLLLGLHSSIAMRFSTAFTILAAAAGSVNAWEGKVLLRFLVYKTSNVLTPRSEILRGLGAL